MSTPPKHLRFKLPIVGTRKMPRLRAAAMRELLAESGAQQDLARAHPPVARDVNTARKKLSRILTRPLSLQLCWSD